MEEECGNYEQSRQIISMGLKLNPLSENLFTKAVKLEDRAPNGAQRVRELVQRIKGNNQATIEKTWRIYLEAALFEGRMGNRKEARQLFSHLMDECKGHGTIYLEASKYEERENQLVAAIDTCNTGIK